MPAILADLSLTGARIITDTLLRPGCEVVLEWGRFDAFGEVVWCHARQCGISFFEPISSEMLMATRDMDDSEHLPSDRDLLRGAAQDWARGTTRF